MCHPNAPTTTHVCYGWVQAAPDAKYLHLCYPPPPSPTNKCRGAHQFRKLNPSYAESFGTIIIPDWFRDNFQHICLCLCMPHCMSTAINWPVCYFAGTQLAPCVCQKKKPFLFHVSRCSPNPRVSPMPCIVFGPPHRAHTRKHIIQKCSPPAPPPPPPPTWTTRPPHPLGILSNNFKHLSRSLILWPALCVHRTKTH